MHLPQQVREAITAHSTNCHPDECCGLFATNNEGDVKFLYPLTNSDPSPTTYTIEPTEHYQAQRHAEAMGWIIGGVFHSHPSGPAEPSAVDMANALDPQWTYLIASGDLIRAFLIRDDQVAELTLT